MDDYIFENFSYFEDGEQCMSYFHDADQHSYEQSLFGFSKSQELKSTAESESHLTEETVEKIQKRFKEGLFKYQTREKMKIQITSQSTRNKYLEAKKGSKGDTSDLTTNCKTMIKNIFEESKTMNKLDPPDLSRVQSYKYSNSNISAVRRLFGVETTSDGLISILRERKEADSVRKIFTEKLSDPSIVDKTLSSKLSFQSKITFLKYMEVMRKAGIIPSEFQGWKNLPQRL